MPIQFLPDPRPEFATARHALGLAILVTDHAGQPVSTDVTWHILPGPRLHQQRAIMMHEATRSNEAGISSNILKFAAHHDGDGIRLVASAGAYGQAIMNLPVDAAETGHASSASGGRHRKDGQGKKNGYINFSDPGSQQTLSRTTGMTLAGYVVLGSGSESHLLINFAVVAGDQRQVSIDGPVYTDSFGRFSTNMKLDYNYNSQSLQLRAYCTEADADGFSPTWRVYNGPFINIVPLETPPLTIHEQHEIKATYAWTQSGASSYKDLHWSSNDPSYVIFDTGSSVGSEVTSTTGQDGTSTIKVVGWHDNPNVIVSAWGADYDAPDNKDWGHSYPIQFAAGGPPQGPSGSITIDYPPGPSVLPRTQPITIQGTVHITNGTSAQRTVHLGDPTFWTQSRYSIVSPVQSDSQGRFQSTLTIDIDFIYDRIWIEATSDQGINSGISPGWEVSAPGSIVFYSPEWGSTLPRNTPITVLGYLYVPDWQGGTSAYQYKDVTLQYFMPKSGASVESPKQTDDKGHFSTTLTITNAFPDDTISVLGRSGSFGGAPAIPWQIAPATQPPNSVTIEPPSDGAVLPVRFDIAFRAKYATTDGTSPTGNAVSWAPAQLPTGLVWNNYLPQTTDSQGYVTGFIRADVAIGPYHQPVSVTATIAGVTSPAKSVTFDASAGGGPGEVTVSVPGYTDETPTLPGGTDVPILAVYRKADGTTPGGSSLRWRALDAGFDWPEPRVGVTPNPSPVAHDGTSRPTVRSNAAEGLIGVILDARWPNPYAPTGFDIGQKEVSFDASTSPPPPPGRLVFTAPPDGVPQPVRTHVPVTVRYTLADGTSGIEGAPLTWSFPNGKPSEIDWWGPEAGSTGENGYATRYILANPQPGVYDKSVAVSVSIADPSVTGVTAPQKTIHFNATIGGGPGVLTVTSKDGVTLSGGVPHEFDVAYCNADNTPAANKALTWSTLPDSADFAFSPPPPHSTRSDGTASIFLTYTGKTDLRPVYVLARSPNPYGVEGGVDSGMAGPLIFKAAMSGAVVIDQPADNAILPVRTNVQFRAKYSPADGSNPQGQLVTWLPKGTDLPMGVFWRRPLGSFVGSDGYAINQLYADVPLAPYLQDLTVTAAVAGITSAGKHVTFDAAHGGGPGRINVETPEFPGILPTLDGGAWNQLKATYYKADGSLATGGQLAWTGTDAWENPFGDIVFDPNPSPIRSGGTSVLRVKSTARTGHFAVDLWASIANPDANGGRDRGGRQVSFGPSGVQSVSIPNDLTIVAPPDGVPQPVRTPVEITAHYTLWDGTGIGGAALNWTIVDRPVPPEISWWGGTQNTNNTGYASRFLVAQPPPGPYNRSVTVEVSVNDPSITNVSPARRTVNFNATTGGGPGSMTVTSADGAVLSGGLPHRFDLTYVLADNHPAQQRSIAWSTMPSNPDLIVSPPPYTTGSDGRSSVQLTYTGTTDLDQIVIQATSSNPHGSDGNHDIGRSPPVKFLASSGATSRVIFTAPSDTPQPVRYPVTVTARYVGPDGQGIDGKMPSWSWASTKPPEIDWSSAPEPTHNGGYTSRTITAAAPVGYYNRSALVTVSIENVTPAQPKTIIFNSVTGGGPGAVTVSSRDGTQLSSGVPHAFDATYFHASGTTATDKQLTWSTSPQNPNLTISGSPSGVHANGSSSVTVTYTGTTDLGGVTVTASSPNQYAPNGQDSGTSPEVTFLGHASPPPPAKLTAFIIDKPYAHAPSIGNVVDPTAPDQIITASLVLTDANDQGISGQSITISTVPPGVPLKLFGTNNQPITGNSVSTGDGGRATIKVGADNWANFGLKANSATLASATTDLVIGTVARIFENLDQPWIDEMQGNTLPLPTAQPKLTFTVFIPPPQRQNRQPPMNGTDPLAVWLNDRIVFIGTVNDAVAGVPVAYATLLLDGNLLTGQSYQLAYVVQNAGDVGRQSHILRFSVDPNGTTPQISPPQNVNRPWDQPIVGDGSFHFYADTIVGGVAITVPASAIANASVGSIVTAHAYLDATYAPLSTHQYDVLTVTRTLRQEDLGKSVTLTFEQASLAGYNSGGFIVDYTITTQAGSTWSKMTPSNLLSTDRLKGS